MWKRLDRLSKAAVFETFFDHLAALSSSARWALGRGRYERPTEGARGWRNGHRERQGIGTFGARTVKIPRARMIEADGQASEWRSKALRRHRRLTKKAEALIAAICLAGTNTRRVKRALSGLFDGAGPLQHPTGFRRVVSHV